MTDGLWDSTEAGGWCIGQFLVPQEPEIFETLSQKNYNLLLQINQCFVNFLRFTLYHTEYYSYALFSL